MNWKAILLTVALIWLYRLLEKKFPAFFERIEIPLMVAATALIIAYCGMSVYGIYDVAISDVSRTDKITFAIWMGLLVSIYVVAVVMLWREWFRKRNEKKRPPTEE